MPRVPNFTWLQRCGLVAVMCGRAGVQWGVKEVDLGVLAAASREINLTL